MLYPVVFSTCLALDEPPIVQQSPLLHERVQMESLRLSFERHFAIHLGRWLIFVCAFVVLEVIKAIPFKDGGTGKRRATFERVTVDPQFSSIPHAPLQSAGEENQ